MYVEAEDAGRDSGVSSVDVGWPMDRYKGMQVGVIAIQAVSRNQRVEYGANVC